MRHYIKSIFEVNYYKGSDCVMINTDKLINTSEIVYRDLFSSSSNKKDTSIHEKSNLIKLSQLINTSEIIYEDMLSF